MNDEKLRSMPVKALRELRDRVDQAMAKVELREKQELLARMSALASDHGLSLAELMDAPAMANRRKSNKRA